MFELIAQDTEAAMQYYTAKKDQSRIDILRKGFIYSLKNYIVPKDSCT